MQNGVSAVKRAMKDMTMLMPAYHVQVYYQATLAQAGEISSSLLYL